jgi:hypothetical protein
LTTTFVPLMRHWLLDYNEVRLCLRTADTSGPIVHPPGDMWTWRAMVVMMPSGDNSWLVDQSSLGVLPAETSGVSRRTGWRRENFVYSVSETPQGIFNVL